MNATLGSNTNASCPAALHSPNVTALKLSVMPSMLATDTDCGSFTGYDAFVTISESGGTTGSSERTVAVTPYAQVPLTATGIHPTERGWNADDSHHPRQSLRSAGKGARNRDMRGAVRL